MNLKKASVHDTIAELIESEWRNYNSMKVGQGCLGFLKEIDIVVEDHNDESRRFENASLGSIVETQNASCKDSSTDCDLNTLSLIARAFLDFSQKLSSIHCGQPITPIFSVAITTSDNVERFAGTSMCLGVRLTKRNTEMLPTASLAFLGTNYFDGADRKEAEADAADHASLGERFVSPPARLVSHFQETVWNLLAPEKGHLETLIGHDDIAHITTFLSLPATNDGEPLVPLFRITVPVSFAAAAAADIPELPSTKPNAGREVLMEEISVGESTRSRSLSDTNHAHCAIGDYKCQKLSISDHSGGNATHEDPIKSSCIAEEASPLESLVSSAKPISSAIDRNDCSSASETNAACMPGSRADSDHVEQSLSPDISSPVRRESLALHASNTSSNTCTGSSTPAYEHTRDLAGLNLDPFGMLGELGAHVRIPFASRSRSTCGDGDGDGEGRASKATNISSEHDDDQAARERIEAVKQLLNEGRSSPSPYSPCASPDTPQSPGAFTARFPKISRSSSEMAQEMARSMSRQVDLLLGSEAHGNKTSNNTGKGYHDRQTDLHTEIRDLSEGMPFEELLQTIPGDLDQVLDDENSCWRHPPDLLPPTLSPSAGDDAGALYPISDAYTRRGGLDMKKKKKTTTTRGKVSVAEDWESPLDDLRGRGGEGDDDGDDGKTEQVALHSGNDLMKLDEKQVAEETLADDKKSGSDGGPLSLSTLVSSCRSLVQDTLASLRSSAASSRNISARVEPFDEGSASRFLSSPRPSISRMSSSGGRFSRRSSANGSVNIVGSVLQRIAGTFTPGSRAQSRVVSRRNSFEDELPIVAKDAKDLKKFIENVPNSSNASQSHTSKDGAVTPMILASRANSNVSSVIVERFVEVGRGDYDDDEEEEKCDGDVDTPLVSTSTGLVNSSSHGHSGRSSRSHLFSSHWSISQSRQRITPLVSPSTSQNNLVGLVTAEPSPQEGQLQGANDNRSSPRAETPISCVISNISLSSLAGNDPDATSTTSSRIASIAAATASAMSNAVSSVGSAGKKASFGLFNGTGVAAATAVGDQLGLSASRPQSRNDAGPPSALLRRSRQSSIIGEDIAKDLESAMEALENQILDEAQRFPVFIPRIIHGNGVSNSNNNNNSSPRPAVGGSRGWALGPSARAKEAPQLSVVLEADQEHESSILKRASSSHHTGGNNETMSRWSRHSQSYSSFHENDPDEITSQSSRRSTTNLGRSGSKSTIRAPTFLDELENRIAVLAKESLLGGQDNARRHFLVVDDCPVSRKFVSRLLSSEGQIVTEAVDGLDCLHIIEDAVQSGVKFDVILLDKEMPFIDGEDLVKLIHEKLGTNDVPPIFGLTGHTRLEEVKSFMSHGVDAVLSKPLRLPALVEELKTHDSKLLAHRQVNVHQPGARDADNPTSVVPLSLVRTASRTSMGDLGNGKAAVRVLHAIEEEERTHNDTAADMNEIPV